MCASKGWGIVKKRIVAVVGAVLMFGGLSPQSAVGTHIDDRTITGQFDPVGANGNVRPRLHVRRVVRGECWSGAVSSQQADAWRCITRNVIHDPCFKGWACSRR